MKARIVNNKFNSIYTDEYLTKISEEWDLTEILPTEEELKYISLMFDFSTNKYYEGATAEEMAEEKKLIVPGSISQMKLRMQLILSGISIASIYAMIEQIPDQMQKELIYAKWEYAVIFDRNDATLNQMVQLLGITSEQLDDIFINGNKL